MVSGQGTIPGPEACLWVSGNSDGDGDSMYIRLLHPQHLDGIWIGLIQYRLPYAPLSEYPEPWF